MNGKFYRIFNKQRLNFKKKETREKYLFYGLLFLISLLSFFKLNNNSDEGVILSGAWHLLNGYSLYSDIFSYIAPGSFYFVYFLWKIFGASYFLVKVLTFIGMFFSGVGLYKSINLIVKRSVFSILIPLLFIFLLVFLPVINHNFFSIFILIYATYFCLLFLKKKKNKFLLISGFLTGLSVLFLQQRGLAFFAASFIYLFIYLCLKKIKIKNFLLYIVSFFIPLLLFLFWPIKTIFYNLIYFPIFNYTEINSFYNFFVLCFFMGLVVFLFVVFMVQRKKNNGLKNDSIWYLFLIQLFLFFSALTLPDFYHLIICLFPSMLIIVFLLENNSNKINKAIKYFLIFLLIVNIFKNSYILFFSSFDNKNIEARNEINEMIKQECKSQYVYFGPFLPQFYFKLRKINPCSFDVLFTNHNTPEQFELAKKQIIEKQPDCGLFYLGGKFKKFNYNKNNDVYKYFEDNYNLIYNKNNIFLYKKYE